MTGIAVLASLAGIIAGLVILARGVIALPHPFDQIVGGILLTVASVFLLAIAYLLESDA